jgi:hypothetical protein
MPDKSKFEREIDEILEKSEDQEKQRASGSRSTGRRRSFEPFSPRVPRRKPPRRSTSIKINPGNVIVAGVILFAVAAFSPVAKIPIAIVGLLLVVGGYALWFRKGFPTGYGPGSSGSLFRRGKSTTKAPDSEPQVKYWRGRRIEEKPAPPKRGKIIEFGPPDDTGDEK